VIEEIMPATAACAESFAVSPGTGLFPEEEALVARATEQRRQEFAAGRECAREALSALGLGKVPILRGYRGAPQWPPGVVGSITHCPGYCAAAVARSGDLTAMGLHAEPDVPLPGGVLELVSQPAERARLRDLSAAAPETSWDRLLFCAKEAVYKAWFGLADRTLARLRGRGDHHRRGGRNLWRPPPGPRPRAGRPAPHRLRRPLASPRQLPGGDDRGARLTWR
jgi:4'-phosphopantetheinyl transferase EntD